MLTVPGATKLHFRNICIMSESFPISEFDSVGGQRCPGNSRFGQVLNGSSPASLGASPPVGGILHGTSPQLRSLNSLDKAAHPHAAAKKFWNRLLFDRETLDAEEFTVSSSKRIIALIILAT